MAIGTALLMAGATVAGSAISANAAGDAADAQTASADAGIAEQQRQFDEIRELLSPYVNAGNSAIAGQLDLLGLNGNEAQQAAIQTINESSQMQELTKAGEGAILANASATGGLRGGNTQSALAQFRPTLLNQLIEQQYGRLGGLTSVGQNAAAGVGNAGQASANNITQLLQQQGAAQAGASIAQGNAIQSGIGGLANIYGYNQGIVPVGGGALSGSLLPAKGF